MTLDDDNFDDLIKERTENKFKYWKTPYSLRGVENSNEAMLNLMDKYPPLLSVDGPTGDSIREQAIIFNKDVPNQPWLTIHKNDPNYNWIFTYPFSPAGLTFYILVDLPALADLKPLGNLMEKQHS